MQCHRQLQLVILMGLPYCIGNAFKNIDRPEVMIGSSIIYAIGPPYGISSISKRKNQPGHSSQAFQWAYPITLVTVHKTSMGPTCWIRSTSQKNNRPRCGHWQLHMCIQWACPVASGALLKKIIGPVVAIGSYIYICNGLTLLHWGHFSKK